MKKMTIAAAVVALATVPMMADASQTTFRLNSTKNSIKVVAKGMCYGIIKTSATGTIKILQLPTQMTADLTIDPAVDGDPITWQNDYLINNPQDPDGSGPEVQPPAQSVVLSGTAKKLGSKTYILFDDAATSIPFGTSASSNFTDRLVIGKTLLTYANAFTQLTGNAAFNGSTTKYLNPAKNLDKRFVSLFKYSKGIATVTETSNMVSSQGPCTGTATITRKYSGGVLAP